MSAQYPSNVKASPPGLPDSAKTEDMLASDQWLAYCRARDNGHLTFVKDAKLYERFYTGDQWDEETVKLLDKEKRPHVTVNLVLTTINAVVGEYIGQRQDIVFRARSRGAQEGTAKALTRLAKVVTDDSHSRWAEKSMFEDGIIQNRGFMEMRLDFGENIEGEIRECALDPVDVLIDPGARDYDPKTWAEVFVTRWLTPDQVAMIYGREKADKITYMAQADTYGIDSISFNPETFSQDRAYFTNSPQVTLYEDDWKRVHRVRVIQRQYYVNTMRPYFVDGATGDKSPVPEDWKPERIQQVAKQFGLYVIPQPERRVRVRTTVDKYVLSDGWSPFRRFNIIPFFPYFRRGKPFGLVANLVSPQELLNKSVSQELHVINTTANSGWIIEEGSLVGMTTEELKVQGAQSGLVLAVNRGTQVPPTKIQPNQIPTGLDRLTQHAGVFFRDISGVSDAMLGQPGREISGEALQRKEMRGLVQLDTVFDNLARTRQYRAELMLEIFQDYYRDSRVFKIITAGEDGEQMTDEVKLNFVNATNEIVNDVTLGEYSVVVSSRPARDVEDDTQFQQMIQMREAGVMMPDWAIVESSSLDRKDEIAEWIRKTQGAAAPTQAEIEAAQMQQELMLRRQEAEIAQIQSKVQTNLSQAQLYMAQAQAAGMDMQSEAAKLGAQLRADMEKQLAELEQARQDIIARIEISRQKNETQQQAAMLTALTKRLDTESKERIASMQAAAQANAYRRASNS